MDTQENNKTPQLYTLYDKLYNFSDLQRDADQGFNEYLRTLKRGKKDVNEFRKAYSDLMTGIGDGSITYLNNRFVDSKGRYKNLDKGDKDYYGLMANYIYSKMGKGQEYTPPEDESKIKWGDGAGSRLFALRMFNSNTINVPYFIDLDPYDENTGKRGTQNRARALADLILNDIINDYDNRFREFTPTLKSEYLNYAQLAYNALKDGTIDPGDYLALSRIMPGIAWEDMFSTKGETLKTDNTLEAATNTTTNAETNTATNGSKETKTLQLLFEDYLNMRLPRKDNSSQEYNLNDNSKYGTWTLNLIISSIKAMDDDTLYNYLKTIIDNPTSNFLYDKRFSNANRVSIPAKWLGMAILGRMIAENKLVLDSSNSNIYYIPDMVDTETNSGYYYDASTNSIYKKSILDIPFWKDRLYKKWANSDTSPYFTVAKKHGGVLKAETGTSFNNIYALGNNPDIGYNTYLNNIFKLQAVIDWMKSNYTGDTATSDYANYVKNNVNTRYSAGINNFLNNLYYTSNDAVRLFNTGYLNNGNTLNYVLFGNTPEQYLSRTGGVAYSLLNFGRPSKALGTGDSYNQDPSKAYIDDALGLLTYSRVASLTDPGIKTGQFGDWGDYWKSLGNTGAYYYIALGDTSGRGLWIPTNDTSIEGYTPFDDISSLSQLKETPINNNKSDVYLTDQDSKKKKYSTWNWIYELTPDLIGAGRLFASLHTNNKVARVLDKGLRPILKDTYERYSPVTGAFSEMQFRNRLAADLRRLAARPFTSDASLQLAGLLDANRQARDLEYQGFLADDKEIKRTQDEALARLEDNMARRSDVANYNRASINQTNKEKSELEATRLKSNWLSIDNFLQGMESRVRYNVEDLRRLSLQVALSEAQDNYTRQLNELLNLYKTKHPNATISDMLNNDTYVNAVKKLRSRLQYEYNGILLNKYNMGRYEVPDSYEDILNNTKF